MKFLSLIPLLLSSVPVVYSQMPVDSTMTCHEAVWSDKQWTDAKSNMAKQGLCMYYRGRDPDISTCGKGCDGGVEAVGCMGKYPEGLEDPKGDCFWGGTCICPKDVEWVGDLIATIVTSLGEFFQNIIDAVVCSGILDAIVMSIDIGLSLIPGGAVASTAMRTGIRIAKSISEAGSDKMAFEEWFGAQCNGKPTGIDKVWKDWTGVPDDVLPSFPGGECVKSGKKKKNCKKQPDDKEDEKKEKEEKEKWEKEHNKSTSKKPETKTSSKAAPTSASSKPSSAAPSATSSKSSAAPKPSASSKSAATSKPATSTKSVAPTKTSSSTAPATTSNEPEEGESSDIGSKFVGAISTCTKFYTVLEGQDCSDTGLTTPELVKLNEGLDAACTNLMSGLAYCVAA